MQRFPARGHALDQLIRQSPKYAIQITPRYLGIFPLFTYWTAEKAEPYRKKCEKEKIFSMTIDLPPVAARTVERIRLPLTKKE